MRSCGIETNMELNPKTICILDDNPLHTAAFVMMASGSDSVRMVTCSSVEQAKEKISCPDLILMSLSHGKKCSNLLLHRALDAFKSTIIIGYSSGQWVARRTFRKYRERLIVLTYDEVLETVLDYIAIRDGIESLQQTVPDNQMSYLDYDLEHFLTRLSSRERDVLCLLGKGHGSPEIAEIIGRKKHTVDSHLKNMRGKLQFKGMTELRSVASRIAHTGSCDIFTRHHNHICRHLGGDPVGSCPLHETE